MGNPLRVEAAESALIQLSGALQRKYRADSAYHHVVVALGLRSRSLFGGFVHAVSGPWPVASLALLRPLVEINIFLRFLGQSPDARSRLWMAERHRWSLALVGDLSADAALRAKWTQDIPDDEKLSEWKDVVDAARRDALEAGVAGVGRSGALIPSVSEQVRLLNDPAATEAYVFVYRRFSGDVHGGMVSFDRLAVDESRGDGWLSLSDDVSPDGLYSTRVLAVTTFASTLRLVADAVGIEIGEASDRLRGLFMQLGTDRSGSQTGSEHQ